MAQPEPLRRHLHADDLQAGQAKVRKMYPGRQLQFPAESTQERSQEYLQKPVHIPITLGGPEFFRGLMKSIFNLLGENRPDLALNSAFDSQRSFVLRGQGDLKNFVRFSTSSELPIEERLSEFDHFIGVWSEGEQVFAAAHLYGGIHFLFRLTNQSVGESFSFGYLVIW